MCPICVRRTWQISCSHSLQILSQAEGALWLEQLSPCENSIFGSEPEWETGLNCYRVCIRWCRKAKTLFGFNVVCSVVHKFFQIDLNALFPLRGFQDFPHFADQGLLRVLSVSLPRGSQTCWGWLLCLWLGSHEVWVGPWIWANGPR